MFLADYDPKCKAFEDYTTAAGQLTELLDVEEPPAGRYEEALSA